MAAKSAQDARPGGHLSPLKSDPELCCSSRTEHRSARGPVASRRGRTFHPSSQNAPQENVFSCSQAASHRRCCTQCGQVISAVSEQVCGQRQTRGYDLKCHKELFYIKESEDGGCDYGYTEPYSQGDPQSLVWLQPDCETRRIKRIITQTSQWSPITPWHTPLRRFISHRPDYCVDVCLCFSNLVRVLVCLCMCICLEVYLCVCEHLWDRHPPVCTALNISLLGTLGVNAWNLRHVQYRESCKEGEKNCSLAAAMSVLYTLVSFRVWGCIWVCTRVYKRVCVCVCGSALCPPVSIWINAFVLWEREILETAVNNIIQLLGFVP